MLECSKLSHAYDGVQRLNDVSISVPQGYLLALFGHNGSGKSTLLKMLGGSLPVLSGNVTWMSQSALGNNGYLQLALRKNVGVLFQNTSSDEKLTVFDNLIFFARLYGLNRRNAEIKAQETLAYSGLIDRKTHPVKTLSQGMRRRLELYRSFLHKPQLVFLDEPTAGLDVIETKNFFDFLKRYKQDNNAVIIMASHQADELMCADGVAMMVDGKLVEQATPTTMLKRLDYLRCSFVLDNSDDNAFDNLPLFDREQNRDGSQNAKLKQNYLDNFLKSSLIRDASFKSLSIERPSLADVYRDLRANHAQH